MNLLKNVGTMYDNGFKKLIYYITPKNSDLMNTDIQYFDIDKAPCVLNPINAIYFQFYNF